MRRAHTVTEVRAAEDAVLARTPEGALMRQAAAGLAAHLLGFLTPAYGARVLLLVGAGNNGGDALYAGATLARRGVQVEALLLDPERAHAGGLAMLRSCGGRVVTAVGHGGAYDVVVDGIVGIGGSGGLRPGAAEAVAAVGASPVVAVDVPSGVDSDTGRIDGPHVRATATVTFGSLKACHLVDPGALACGPVHLVELGLDLPSASVAAPDAADVAALLPRPSPQAHKYTRGVVGVRSGSADYPGAALLSVAGAACGLAGMVRFVPPDETVAGLVAAAHPEVVVGAGRVQAWVVGSGGGAGAGQQRTAAYDDGVPVVLDADGLAGLEGPVPVPAVLTPHAGELARLLGLDRETVEASPLEHARAAARDLSAVVLLKGRHSVAAHPDGRVMVATAGPPWLATAGAGDVLAGLVGALLAAGLDPLDAAVAGAWVHGAAAREARPGGPVVAGEVARALPEVCARLLGDGADRP